jgi:hypothetical protein
MVACLKSGDVVIAWRARINPLHIRYQLFDASGPIGVERAMPPTATDGAIAALDNGQFVIAHLNDFGEEATVDTLIVVEIDVFNGDGSPANIHLVSTSEQRIQVSWPTLAPLSGDRFLLAWVQRNVDTVPATTNVKARVFSPQGALGQVTQFNTSSGNQRFSLAAAVVSRPPPDGETAFAAWTDDTESGGDTSGRAVRGRPLTVPAAGF